MSKLMFVPFLFLLLAVVPGCGNSPDPDEDMTYGDEREQLEERLEAKLGEIDALLGDIGPDDATASAEGDTLSMYDQTRRVELQEMRTEIEAHLSALDEQTRQTWNEFSAEVARRIDTIDARLETMRASMQ